MINVKIKIFQIFPIELFSKRFVFTDFPFRSHFRKPAVAVETLLNIATFAFASQQY